MIEPADPGDHGCQPAGTSEILAFFQAQDADQVVRVTVTNTFPGSLPPPPANGCKAAQQSMGGFFTGPGGLVLAVPLGMVAWFRRRRVAAGVETPPPSGRRARAARLLVWGSVAVLAVATLAACEPPKAPLC